MAPQKWIYHFGEGDTKDKFVLGGKGCGLGEMTKIGLPVPPGFTLVTGACVHYSKHRVHPEGLDEELKAAVVRLEKETGKNFGTQGKNGMLLLSVSMIALRYVCV
jgi:pyruvate,orthophosphate dikinase